MGAAEPRHRHRVGAVQVVTRAAGPRPCRHRVAGRHLAPGGGAMTASRDRARAVADAVLYEGYLLYPYRGTSSKNQSRWQFGVLGPLGAADAGLGEDDSLAAQFLVDGAQAITLVVRFLQLQRRRVQRELSRLEGGGFVPVDELTTPSGSWL